MHKNKGDCDMIGCQICNEYDIPDVSIEEIEASLEESAKKVEKLRKEMDTGGLVLDPVPNGFDINEVKLTRIKLEPGEVLAVRIYSNSVDADSLAMLRYQLTSVFPSNKILLFAMPQNDNMTLDVISTAAEEIVENSCAAPTSYCNDCRCGKKERIEREGK
jgi:hypothetical protein